MPHIDPELSRAYHKAYYQANKERQAKQAARLKAQKTPAELQEKREYQRAYYQANRDRLLAQQRVRGRRSYRANPESYRARNRRNLLKRQYGLSENEYAVMLDAQKGICRICGRKMEYPVVDHCHETDQVRGLLCRGCNAALGHFQDSPAILSRAIEYLTKSLSGATSTTNSVPSNGRSENVA